VNQDQNRKYINTRNCNSSTFWVLCIKVMIQFQFI